MTQTAVGAHAAAPRQWYLNGGFDLELAGPMPPALEHLLPEMTLWFLALSTPEDRIALDTTVPPAFVDYLGRAGLDTARSGALPGAVASPWGWDLRSAARLEALAGVQPHPPLDTVARVNSRGFSHALAQRLGCALPGSRACDSPREVGEALAAPGPWPRVVKPNHGNSGIGFFLVKNPQENEAVARRLPSTIAGAQARMFVEPWLTRTHDLSTRFELAQSGELRDMRLCRALVGSVGSSYGVQWMPDDPVVEHARQTLERTASDVAVALHEQGYYGPVNIDGMIAVDNGTQRLLPLLEINARQSMSFVGYTVQNRIAPGQPFMLRTAAIRQPRLRAQVVPLAETVGDDRYDPIRRRGVLALTPAWHTLNGRPTPSRRAIFFVTSPSESDFVELTNRLSHTLRSFRHA